MKVILLQDVAKVGRKFEVSDVSDGYAQNFLIPHKKAVFATPNALARIENERAKHDAEHEKESEELYKALESLEGKRVKIVEKANEQGHLFAQLHAKEIIAAIREQWEMTLPESVLVLDQPIKQTGEHEVLLQAGEKTAKLIVLVEAAE